MQSTATTVDDYIAEAPIERREALEPIRRLCREELTGFEEAMGYGMPVYLRDGEGKIAFASQKAYISFYVLRRAALAVCADRLDGLSVGKGCIRFKRPDRIDPGVIRALLRATVADTGPIC